MTPFLWHGGLMLLAWFALLPGGALAARFCKVLPGQDFPRVRDSGAWLGAVLASRVGRRRRLKGTGQRPAPVIS